MASARVGSPAASAGCQASTGNWLTTSVERTWLRSSMTSSRSLASTMLGGVNRKSSSTSSPILASCAEAAHVASVAAAERQLRQQPRRAHVQCGVAAADGGVSQGAGDE